MSDQTTPSVSVPAPSIPDRMMSTSAQVMLNDALFNRSKQVAQYLANAEGFVPRHLARKSEACFAVVMRSLTWNMDPFAVAQCTYQAPGGAIGYEGKLVQAIIESSGRLEGGVKYDWYGDWSKVQGKIVMKTGKNGNQFPAQGWKPEDEKGLGVKVSAQLIGEAEPREITLDLVQATTRNSTLWASDPKTQLAYLAVRRFGNLAVPHLVMGVPFDVGDGGGIGPEHAKDITPARPEKPESSSKKKEEPEPQVTDVEVPEDEDAEDQEPLDQTEDDQASSNDTEDSSKDGDGEQANTTEQEPEQNAEDDANTSPEAGNDEESESQSPDGEDERSPLDDDLEAAGPEEEAIDWKAIEAEIKKNLVKAPDLNAVNAIKSHYKTYWTPMKEQEPDLYNKLVDQINKKQRSLKNK